jgi:hypothetical protein
VNMRQITRDLLDGIRMFATPTVLHLLRKVHRYVHCSLWASHCVLMCIVSAAAFAAAAASSPLQALDAASRALTGAAAVEMAPALADLVRRGERNNSVLLPLFHWPVDFVVQVPDSCDCWQALV